MQIAAAYALKMSRIRGKENIHVKYIEALKGAYRVLSDPGNIEYNDLINKR